VDHANKLQQSGATSSDVPMLPERVSPPPRRLLLDANLLGTRATRWSHLKICCGRRTARYLT